MNDQQQNALFQKLEALVNQRPPPAANGPVAAPPAAAPMAYGYPVPAAAMMPAGYPGMMPAGFVGQGLQPTGISVPLAIVLPDGGELKLHLHFGPEHAANPQVFAQMVLAQFGHLVSVYRRQPYQGGYQGGGYNGYRGGFRGRRY